MKDTIMYSLLMHGAAILYFKFKVTEVSVSEFQTLGSISDDIFGSHIGISDLIIQD